MAWPTEILSDVKGVLEISDTSQDSLLTTLVNRAKGLVEEVTDRKILQQTFTEYHDGHGEKAIYVNNPPIDTSQTLQVYDDTSREFGSSTLIDSTNLFIDAELGKIIREDAVFQDGIRNVKVVYTGGWVYGTLQGASGATMPAGLEDILIELTVVMYRNIKGKSEFITSKSVEYGVQGIIQTRKYKQILDQLQQYKIIRGR